MRNFTTSELKEVVVNQRFSLLDSYVFILNQMDETCGDNGILYGAMIGW